MRPLFWLSALMIGYVYVGYPVLLAVWARITRRKGREGQDRRDGPDQQELLPSVSIIVAARNEAHRLRARLDNLLSLDYPADRRQIIVVSDGSTDATLETLAAFKGLIDVVALPSGGKAPALNAGVAHAVHPILVFADARQTFARDALRALVAPFADATVGGVTGELVLDCESDSDRRRSLDRRIAAIANAWMNARTDRRVTERRGLVASTIADGVGLYWKYEKQLRRLESAVGSTLGATGAIYALRRSLWRDLPGDTILDDVLAPMRAVLAGQRVVFEERAKAFDRTSPDSYAESRRKVRTLAGNVQILWLEPRLLIPFINPVWFQYYSHKLGRLAVPYALLGLLAANIALAAEGAFYAAALAGQCVFYLLAGYGAYLEWRSNERARAAVRQPVAAGLGKSVLNA
jgi:biofilm PGA synthesis N-glycosyltransferase PgaC